MLSRKQPFKGVLFDLDGTLLDTAADLGLALNKLLTLRQKPPVSQSIIRSVVSLGFKGFLKTGLDMDPSHPEFPAACEELLIHYADHLYDNTRLFPGMEGVLNHLEAAKIPWGIVTNKPEKFTLALLEGLKLRHRAVCVISGDTFENSKPHPQPVLEACKLLQQVPADCLYIGDAEIDMLACKAAGTASLVAMYGYIHKDENPQHWGADGYIDRPEDIISWLKL